MQKVRPIPVVVSILTGLCLGGCSKPSHSDSSPPASATAAPVVTAAASAAPPPTDTSSAAPAPSDTSDTTDQTATAAPPPPQVEQPGPPPAPADVWAAGSWKFVGGPGGCR
jgi:hypothetical protein